MWTIVDTEASALSPKVKLWDAYAYPIDLFDAIDPIILKGIHSTLDAFRCHDYHKGTRLKQYQGAPVKTMRVNDEHRMVISTVKAQNQTIALIHGVVLFHDVQKYNSLFDSQAVYQREQACLAYLSTVVLNQSPASKAEDIEVTFPIETPVMGFK